MLIYRQIIGKNPIMYTIFKNKLYIYRHIIGKNPIICANMYNMTFRREIKEYVDVPLTHQLVSDVLADYQRPNDKISELIKDGSLISLRRGLYIPGPESDLPIPHLFVIANHL